MALEYLKEIVYHCNILIININSVILFYWIILKV